MKITRRADRPPIWAPGRICHPLPLAALAVALVLVPCSLARAELDPQANQPYDLEVVLDIARNPQLTEVFKSRVRQELGDTLQAALGPLGRVKVVDSHPKLADVKKVGLKKALDDWKEVSGKKVHFVLIDFVNRHYVIQARQHDGLTGLNSPLVRRAELPDPVGRADVARTAALMIKQDFGLVGTVDPNDHGEEVHVILKGGQVAQADLDPWIQPNEVFALAQMFQSGNALGGEQVPWAVLQVKEKPKDGVCLCKLFYRYQPNPLEGGPGIQGVRCLKLGTTTAPLHLRLVDEQTRAPIANRTITVSAQGFNPNTGDDIVTNAEGTVQTKDPYENVAFVRLLYEGGTTAYAHVPVPILDDQLVVCPVSLNRKGDALGNLQRQGRFLLEQISNSRLRVNDLVSALNALTRDRRHDEALAKARAGLQALQSDLAKNTADLASLRARASSQGVAEGQLKLGDAETGLQQLGADQKRLQGFINDLQKVVLVEKDPRRREALALMATAKQQQDQADIKEALQNYEKALDDLNDPQAKAKLQQQVDQLKREWTPKDKDAQEDARQFIYETWPKLDTAKQMNDHLADLDQAIQTCAKNNDCWPLKKLSLSATSKLAKLAKELDALSNDPNEDVNQKKKLVSEVSRTLGEKYKLVANLLKGCKPASK